MDKIKNAKPGLSAHVRRAQYPFSLKTLDKLQQTISNLRSNLILAVDVLQLDVTATSLQRLDLVDGKIDTLMDKSKVATSEILQNMSNLHLFNQQESVRLLTAEETNAVAWLSPLDFRAKQSDAFSRSQEGTGEWLLESDTFGTWINSAGGVLWCPGMRKSTLA